MQLRGTILQPWNWHSPKLDGNGKNLFQQLHADANRIKNMGFTAVWLPPSSEGVGGQDDVGYDIKNWYQLDNTKYGNKSQLRSACQALNDNNIEVYHDQVHNHLMGGDIEQGVWCLHVKCNNKNERLDDSRVWFQANIATDYPWLGLNQSHFDAYHPNSHDCWALSGKQFDREANNVKPIRIDYESAVNHDLILLLDKPGIL